MWQHHSKSGVSIQMIKSELAVSDLDGVWPTRVAYMCGLIISRTIPIENMAREKYI